MIYDGQKNQKRKSLKFLLKVVTYILCEYFPHYDMQNDCNNNYINQTEYLIREVTTEGVLLISKNFKLKKSPGV